MPVLDTNFLIALHDEDPAAIAFLGTLDPTAIVLPAVVAAEFLTPYGSHAQSRYDELVRSFGVVHTSAAWVMTVAALRRKLAQAKKRIRLADAWIAAWAILHNTYIVTRNAADFEAMGVGAKTW